MTYLKPNDLPAPDAMIDYGKGQVGAAMFYYAAEGQSYTDIARDAGFEAQYFSLDDDASPQAETLGDEYAGDDPTVLARWTPAIPDGWQLAAKHDTEDGPMAMFIRPSKVPE